MNERASQFVLLSVELDPTGVSRRRTVPVRTFNTLDAAQAEAERLRSGPLPDAWAEKPIGTWRRLNAHGLGFVIYGVAARDV